MVSLILNIFIIFLKLFRLISKCHITQTQPYFTQLVYQDRKHSHIMNHILHDIIHHIKNIRLCVVLNTEFCYFVHRYLPY
jgi:hypothetical protein